MATITLSGSVSTRVGKPRFVSYTPVSSMYTGAVLSKHMTSADNVRKHNIANPRPYSFSGLNIELLTNTSLGSFTGAVTENAIPVENAVVVIFERGSYKARARVTTNSVGVFTTPAIFDKTAADYFAVAFDPPGGVSYNAIIYDKLQAV